MSFLDEETSASDGTWVILFKFEAPNDEYLLGTDDYTLGSDDYTRTTITHSDIEAAIDGKGLEVRMPVHDGLASPVITELVRSYAFEIAPRSLKLTITKANRDSGENAVIWRGKVISVSVQGLEARFLSQSNLDLKSTIPNKRYQRTCQHNLYDDLCQVDRDEFKHETTVASVSSDGLEVTMNSDGGFDDDWFHGGGILRVSDGERRVIVGHTGTKLTLMWPFRELSASDSIEVFAGCDRKIETCDEKFDNAEHFGGHPYMLPKNLFTRFRGMFGLGSWEPKD